MFINDIFKKRQLNEGGFDIPEIPRAPQPKPVPNKDKTVDEAGPFSYGAKKPRKGSVADLAAQKRKEQEKGRQPAEPRDQQVGVARVVKEYGDTPKGQKQLTRVHKRAVDRLIKADDKNMLEPDYTKRDLKTVRKNQATADRAWDRMSDLDEQGVAEGGFDIPEIPRAPQPKPQPKEKTSEDASKYMDTKPSSVTAKQADELGAMARKAFRPDLNPDYYKDDEPVRPRRNWDYSDPDVQPIVKQWMDKNLIDRKPMTYQQDVNEGFDDLDRFMKDKYGPKPRGGSGIKRGTYGQPGRKRGRPTGPSGGEGSGIPQSVDFDRPHSERSAGRRIPRFSDDYDSVKRSEVDEGSVQDKLHRRHQEIRKKRGAPDPEYYKELGKSYDIKDDQERYVRQAEIKKKYKVTNEDVERYVEELERAGYEIVTESATLCPECGGAAYSDRMLAEKQDACYHKVKSRYKVWPSAYASGALVRCRKKGAANWGNKSKK